MARPMIAPPTIAIKMNAAKPNGDKRTSSTLPATSGWSRKSSEAVDVAVTVELEDAVTVKEVDVKDMVLVAVPVAVSVVADRVELDVAVMVDVAVEDTVEDVEADVVAVVPVTDVTVPVKVVNVAVTVEEVVVVVLVCVDPETKA